MPKLELIIDDIGAQGDGVAHVKNTTIFVAGALTGERVEVELDEGREAVKRGELVSILSASKARTKPRCPHFPVCGGCRFQHMNDESYANLKLGQLQKILIGGGISLPHMKPIVITAEQTRRRARMAAKHTERGLTIGFNEWRSHEIIDIQECPVTRPEIVELVAHLRIALTTWLPRGETCDIQITWLHDGFDVVLIGGPRLGAEERQRLAAIAEKLGIAHLSWRKWDRSPIEPIAFHKPLTVRFGKTLIAFPAGSFLQATEAGEQALVDFACEVAKPNSKILDLFCGMGMFGLSLPDVKQVTFADLDEPALSALKHATKNPSKYEINIRNLIGDPFKAHECNAYDMIVYDPPRGGAKAQSVQIAKSKVPDVVAISCDPKSFVRDAKILIDGGYKLNSIQPVDQFLWSPHIELAAHFSKS